MDARLRHRARYPGAAPRRAAETARGAAARAVGGGEGAPLRLPIPPGIVRMVERGLGLPEGAPGAIGLWRWVERRMHRFVSGRLPAGARRVALALDPDTLEVVARFEGPAPGARRRTGRGGPAS